MKTERYIGRRGECAYCEAKVHIHELNNRGYDQYTWPVRCDNCDYVEIQASGPRTIHP